MKTNKFVIRQSFILLMAATIWGVAFVAQTVGLRYIGPFTFNAVRFFLGALVLLPVIGIQSQKKGYKKKEKADSKLLWKSGLLCGGILCVASNLQQFALQYSEVGKAGFITAMYIVIVPVLGILFGKKASVRIWIGVALSVIGLYLLCVTGEFELTRGDFLLVLCALTFSLHIIVIDSTCTRIDGVKLSCIQFGVSGFFSMIMMFGFEHPEIPLIVEAWRPLLYAGIMSCGIAYTFQIIGQRGVHPTTASLIMSLESVISALAGFLLLGQVMTIKEMLGSIFMFLAIVLVQIPESVFRFHHKKKDIKAA